MYIRHNQETHLLYHYSLCSRLYLDFHGVPPNSFFCFRIRIGDHVAFGVLNSVTTPKPSIGAQNVSTANNTYYQTCGSLPIWEVKHSHPLFCLLNLLSEVEENQAALADSWLCRWPPLACGHAQTTNQGTHRTDLTRVWVGHALCLSILICQMESSGTHLTG